ncbi:transcriptional regulator [Betaproteobacteria bacterium]|nr:transcriptional regulator [Betaproteobacteria bacterium]
MNLKFVETFVWVARLRSITRAAEKMCLTQSAVSNRIATLEDELGVELINRHNPRFRLSDAGTRFMDYAEKLLMIEREMRSEFSAPERQAFTLRIGAIESVLHTWLIPMVDALKRSSPLTNFELTIETSLNLAEQIRRGALDLIFSALPVQEESLINEILEPFEMVFVGAKTMTSPVPHESLELDALLRHEILTFQRGSHPHISLINALHAAGVDDKHVHAVSSISALALLAGNGFGIATLPRCVAEQLGPDTKICILETSLPLAPLPLHASYWSTLTNPFLKQSIQEALTFARDYGAQRNATERNEQPPPARATAQAKS